MPLIEAVATIDSGCPGCAARTRIGQAYRLHQVDVERAAVVVVAAPGGVRGGVRAEHVDGAEGRSGLADEPHAAVGVADVAGDGHQTVAGAERIRQAVEIGLRASRHDDAGALVQERAHDRGADAAAASCDDDAGALEPELHQRGTVSPAARNPPST